MKEKHGMDRRRDILIGIFCDKSWGMWRMSNTDWIGSIMQMWYSKNKQKPMTAQPLEDIEHEFWIKTIGSNWYEKCLRIDILQVAACFFFLLAKSAKFVRNKNYTEIRNKSSNKHIPNNLWKYIQSHLDFWLTPHSKAVAKAKKTKRTK